MAKVTSLILLISLLIVLITIAVYADPQAEGPVKRVRAKQSAIRKKKPLLSKVKLPEAITTLAPEEDESGATPSEVEASLTSPSSQEKILSESVPNELSTAPTILTTGNNPKAKAKKALVKNNGLQQSPRPGVPVPDGCGECELDECTTPPENSCNTGLVNKANFN
jgi:hypothetical protein